MSDAVTEEPPPQLNDVAAQLDRVEDVAENIFARFEEDSRQAQAQEASSGTVQQEEPGEETHELPEPGAVEDPTPVTEDAEPRAESNTDTEHTEQQEEAPIEATTSTAASDDPQPIDDVIEAGSTTFDDRDQKPDREQLNRAMSNEGETAVADVAAEETIDDSNEREEEAVSPIMEGDDVYNVDRILDKRPSEADPNKFEYLVQWEGDYECTWEPEENMIACANMLKNFNRNWRRKQAKKEARQAAAKKKSSESPGPQRRAAGEPEPLGPKTITTVTSSGRKAKRLAPLEVPARASPAGGASDKKGTFAPWKKRLLARSQRQKAPETPSKPKHLTKKGAFTRSVEKPNPLKGVKKKPTQVKLKTFASKVKKKVVGRLTRQQALQSGQDVDPDGSLMDEIDKITARSTSSPKPTAKNTPKQTAKPVVKKKIVLKKSSPPPSSAKNVKQEDDEDADRKDLESSLVRRDVQLDNDRVQRKALVQDTELDLPFDGKIKVANVQNTDCHPAGGVAFLLRPYASTAKSTYAFVPKIRKGFLSTACGEVKVKTGLDLFILTYFAQTYDKTKISDAELIHCGRVLGLLRQHEINVYEAANSTRIPAVVLRAWLRISQPHNRIKVEGIDGSEMERKNSGLGQVLRQCAEAGEYERKVAAALATPRRSATKPTKTGQVKIAPYKPADADTSPDPEPPKPRPRVVARRLPNPTTSTPKQPGATSSSSSSNPVFDALKAVARPPPAQPAIRIPSSSRAAGGSSSSAAMSEAPNTSRLRIVKRKPDYSHMGALDEDESEDYVPDDVKKNETPTPKKRGRPAAKAGAGTQPKKQRLQTPVVKLKLGRWKYTSVAPMLNEVFRLMCRIHLRGDANYDVKQQALKTWHICEMINWGNLTSEQAAKELGMEVEEVENVAIGIAHARKFEPQQIKAAQIPGMSFMISEELLDVHKTPLEYLQDRLDPKLLAWSAQAIYKPQEAADTLLHILKYARGLPDLSNSECSYAVCEHKPTRLPELPPYRLPAATFVYDCRQLRQRPDVIEAGGIKTYLSEGALVMGTSEVLLRPSHWNQFVPDVHPDMENGPKETVCYIDVNPPQNAYAIVDDTDDWAYRIDSFRARFAEKHHQVVRVLHLIAAREQPKVTRFAVLSYVNVRYVIRQTCVPKMKQVDDAAQEEHAAEYADDYDEQPTAGTSEFARNSHVQEIDDGAQMESVAAVATLEEVQSAEEEMQEQIASEEVPHMQQIDEDDIRTHVIGGSPTVEQEIETEVIPAPPEPDADEQVVVAVAEQQPPEEEHGEEEDEREPNFSMNAPDVTGDSETLDVIGSPEPQQQPMSIEQETAAAAQEEEEAGGMQQQEVIVNGNVHEDEHDREGPSPTGTEPFDEEPPQDNEEQQQQEGDEEQIDVDHVMTSGVDVLAAATHHIEQVSPSKLPVASHAILDDSQMIPVSDSDASHNESTQQKNYSSMFGSEFDQ